MKLLYIGQIIEKTKTGGEICTKNNFSVLKALFKQDFYTYELKIRNNISVTLNKLFFLYPGVSIFSFNKIKKTVLRVNPEIIFISTAQYGMLARFLKKYFPSIQIITFFHNVEILYAKDYLSLFNLKSWYFYLLTKINESKAIKFSDYIFSITNKDSIYLENIYKRKADLILPFVCECKQISELEKKSQTLSKPIFLNQCLFVGSNFFGNTEGLKWFIDNVISELNTKLIIVGNGMSSVFNNSQNIEVHDYVEDLSKFYYETDFVILPIISGSGMKTKVAEALSFGKAIIGSDIAFEGYENIEHLHGIYRCNSIQEYKDAFIKIYNDNLSYFNRNIFDFYQRNYTLDSNAKRVSDFLAKENLC